MTADRADEIAREVVVPLDQWKRIYENKDHADQLMKAIAAALRSYADEKLELVARTVTWDYDAEFIRSLKSKDRACEVDK